RLVARQHQAARIAPRVLLLAHLEVAHHVLVEERQTVELLHQIEGDVRSVVDDGATNNGEIAADAGVSNLMTERLQRLENVVLGLAELTIAPLELTARRFGNEVFVR